MASADWYSPSGVPGTRAQGSSLDVRNEFLRLATATDKLPALSGNAGKVIAVNASGSALESVSTLAGMTLTNPVLTLPQINDTSLDHQYLFAVSELVADRTVTLPLLASNDTFVFAAHAQTLTNKAFNGTLGATTAASVAATTGTFSGTLGVTGTSTLAAVNATNGTFSGTLGVTGAATFESTVAGAFNGTLGATTRASLAATTGNFDGGLTATSGGSLTGTWSDLGAVTTMDLNGGTIDATVIGGTTRAAGSFTTGSFNARLTALSLNVTNTSGVLTNHIIGGIAGVSNGFIISQTASNALSYAFYGGAGGGSALLSSAGALTLSAGISATTGTFSGTITVGANSTIRESSDDLHLGNGITNLRFFDTEDRIIPVLADGSPSDGATSLGRSSHRFKDILLSGAVSAATGTFSGALASSIHTITGNDNSNVRITFDYVGAAGDSYSLIGGLNGASNNGFSIRNNDSGVNNLVINDTLATFSGNVSLTGAVGNLVLAPTAGLVDIDLAGTGAAGYDRFRIKQGVTGVSNSGMSIFDIDAAVTRLAIDTNGNFLVGATNASLSVGSGLKVLQSATVPQMGIVTNNASAPTAVFTQFNTNGTLNGYRFYTRNDGGIANFSANNVNLSDRNSKKDITPHTADEWCCVKAWEIVDYRYKDDPAGMRTKIGVIAQQIQQHSPDVTYTFQEAADAVAEVLDGDGNVVTVAMPAIEYRMGVNEPQMFWKVTKVLQEAMGRIETITQRIEALEPA